MTYSLLWPVNRVSSAMPFAGVELWAWTHASLDVELDRHTKILSLSELERMRRFRFREDQLQFATSHANIRRILSAYLTCQPHLLEFASTSLGKPYLVDAPVHFNLSHTSRLGILAVSCETHVGVDIETIRPIEADVALAHFSTRELSDLEHLPEPVWLRGFYNCWTRKEAILKAEGIGLNPPLASFDVSLLPDAKPLLLDSRPESGIGRDWILHHLAPAIDTVGAVASTSTNIRCYAFEE